MTIFKTQEVGSLDKLAFRVKSGRDLQPTDEDIHEATFWAARIGLKFDEALLKKKDKNAEDLHKINDLASIFALRFFDSAGLDIVYDGEQKRSEMYQHAVNQIEGLEFLGNTRIFDNKYYKMATSLGKVNLAKPYHVEEFRFVRQNTTKEVKVPITGATTLGYFSDAQWYCARWSKKASDPRTRNFDARREFVLDLARYVVKPNIEALANEGAQRIQIDEPAAGMHTKKEDLELFVEAFDESVSGIGAKFSVHICFSDYRALLPEILEMKNCSQLTLEFADRDGQNLGIDATQRIGYSDLNLFKEYGFSGEIGLGVINVHTNLVPSSDLVRDRILYAAGIIDPQKLFVNPDCGLRTRSWQIAYQMLTNMVQGAQSARKVLGS